MTTSWVSGGKVLPFDFRVRNEPGYTDKKVLTDRSKEHFPVPQGVHLNRSVVFWSTVPMVVAVGWGEMVVAAVG
jgi:hypothetical protein